MKQFILGSKGPFWAGVLVVLVAVFGEVSPCSAGTPAVLRLVESGLLEPLSPELEQHEADLRSQGWEVETLAVPRRNARLPFQHMELALNVIWPRLAANSDLHVFFIGCCPLPYSGIRTNPDGHAGSAGAYACTAYYAIPSDGWTDLLDNSGLLPRSKQLNLPGDGKFDQELLPDLPKACVGFLDLSPLNPKSWGSDELKTVFLLEKYREWFGRCHDYRQGAWTPRHLTANGSWNGLPAGGFRDWSRSEYGVTPIFFRDPDITSDQTFAIAGEAPFGVMWDFKVMTVPASWWAARREPWSVLYLYFGSYQIDFGTTQMSLPLGGGALATASNGFGSWNLEGASKMTLGELWRQTLLTRPFALMTSLYGDPTLRLPQQ